MICGRPTKSGEPCQRIALWEGDYCFSHRTQRRSGGKDVRYKAPKCKGLTKKGNACNNHIIQGDFCWLHEQTTIDTVDPRIMVLVKCFKCPYCGTLTEIK